MWMRQPGMRSLELLRWEVMQGGGNFESRTFMGDKTLRAVTVCADLARDLMSLACKEQISDDDLMRLLVEHFEELSILNRPAEHDLDPGEERLPRNSIELTVVITRMKMIMGFASERTIDHIRGLAFWALCAVRNECMPDDFDWAQTASFLTPDEIDSSQRFYPSLNNLVREIVQGPMPDQWREQFGSFLDGLND